MQGGGGFSVQHHTATDMLHQIKAAVRRIKRIVRTHGSEVSRNDAVERCVVQLLRNAIASESPFDIAIVLGSAAELMIFPDDCLMEQFTSAVQTANQLALRAVVWAVRHRCAKAGRRAHRFSLEPRVFAVQNSSTLSRIVRDS